MDADENVTPSGAIDTTLTRALSALALHLAGANDTQIAQQLGYATAGHARVAWEKALAAGVTDDDKKAERTSEAARLNRLQMAWWNKAINPNDPQQATASRMVLAIMERRARMLGLDAPTRVEVYTPTSQEISAYVDMLRTQAGIGDEQEPDILELDSVAHDEAL